MLTQTATDEVLSEGSVRAAPAEDPSLTGHLCWHLQPHTEVLMRKREGYSPMEGTTLPTTSVHHKPALLLLGNS